MGPVRDFGPYRAILQERCTSLLFDSAAESVASSSTSISTGDAWTTNDVGTSILAAAATVSDEELSTDRSCAARSHSPPVPAGSGSGTAMQRLMMVSPAHTTVGKNKIKNNHFISVVPAF